MESHVLNNKRQVVESIATKQGFAYISVNPDEQTPVGPILMQLVQSGVAEAGEAMGDVVPYFLTNPAFAGVDPELPVSKVRLLMKVLAAFGDDSSLRILAARGWISEMLPKPEVTSRSCVDFLIQADRPGNSLLDMLERANNYRWKAHAHSARLYRMGSWLADGRTSMTGHYRPEGFGRRSPSQLADSIWDMLVLGHQPADTDNA